MISEDEHVTLQNLVEAGCFNFAQELSEVSAKATAEAAAETVLKKVEAIWKDYELNVVPFTNMKDVFILKRLDEVNNLEYDNMIFFFIITRLFHHISFSSISVRDDVGRFPGAYKYFIGVTPCCSSESSCVALEQIAGDRLRDSGHLDRLSEIVDHAAHCVCHQGCSGGECKVCGC